MAEPTIPPTQPTEPTKDLSLTELLDELRKQNELNQTPGDCNTGSTNSVVTFGSSLYNDIFHFLTCKGVAPYFAHTVSGILTAPVIYAGKILGFFFGIVASVFSTLAGAILAVLGEGREKAAPQLNTLITTTMNEMFGTEFTAAELPRSGDANAAKTRAILIGRKISDHLEEEFTKFGPLSPLQGKDAANMFTGFTVNFSVVSAYIAIIAQMIGGEHGAGFRELGVELAENLGLGRMSRKGITELVSTCVAEPYQWHLNKQYRPTLLGPTQAVRAWLSDSISHDDMIEELARQGYSDNRINAFIAETVKDLTFQQINVLRQFSLITEADSMTLLKRMGYNEGNAKLVLQAEDALGAQIAARQIANRLVNEFLEGSITETEFSDTMARLAFTDAERTRIIGMAGQMSRLPRKILSLAQMREAYIHATIDLVEWEQYLIRVGYRQEDRQILTLELLLDAKADSLREELKQKREAELAAKRAAAAGTTEPA